ncbi:MAG: rRNA maturation RNase YbeY [Flavobacteriales bacterium]
MIQFFSKNHFIPENQKALIDWIEKVVIFHQGKIVQIHYIFCNDHDLLKINQEFLQHNDYTDIITFDDSIGKQLEGEIYISTDRVQENANNFKVDFEEELRRVLIHGVLHLLGFKDKTLQQKNQMTEKENEALQLYKL